MSKNGKFEGIYNACTVEGRSSVGGIVGESDTGEVLRCSNYAQISGMYAVGGICGWGTSQVLTECANFALIKGNRNHK